jgi:hypothetical protein
MLRFFHELALFRPSLGRPLPLPVPPPSSPSPGTVRSRTNDDDDDVEDATTPEMSAGDGAGTYMRWHFRTPEAGSRDPTISNAPKRFAPYPRTWTCESGRREG